MRRIVDEPFRELFELLPFLRIRVDMRVLLFLELDCNFSGCHLLEGERERESEAQLCLGCHLGDYSDSRKGAHG